MSDLLQNSGRLRQVKSWQSCHHWSLPLLNYCLVMEKNPWKSSKGLDWHGKQNSAPAKIMNHKLMAHSKKYSKWEELNACSSSFLQFMFDVLKETDRKILRKASSLLFSRAWRKDCLVVSNSIMLNLATKAATRLVRETWSHTAWFWTLTMPPRKNYHDKILAEYHLTDWFEKHFCYRNRPSMSNRSWKNNVTRRAFATRLYPHAERDSNASTYPNHPNPGELQIDPWNCCLWRGIGKAQIISDLYWCVHLPCALNGTQRHSTALNGTQRHSTALNGTQCHHFTIAALHFWSKHWRHWRLVIGHMNAKRAHYVIYKDESRSKISKNRQTQQKTSQPLGAKVKLTICQCQRKICRMKSRKRLASPPGRWLCGAQAVPVPKFPNWFPNWGCKHSVKEASKTPPWIRLTRLIASCRHKSRQFPPQLRHAQAISGLKFFFSEYWKDFSLDSMAFVFVYSWLQTDQRKHPSGQSSQRQFRQRKRATYHSTMKNFAKTVKFTWDLKTTLCSCRMSMMPM